MLPTGLFIESPEMNDISLTKLDQNAESWPEEIVQKLRERIPQTAGMNTVVKFMKQDEENGAATGSVVVGSATKTAVVPVIIKDFSLYPLDVMIVDQKLLPLTPDYFGGAFQGTNPFVKLEEFPMYSGLHRFEDVSLWQANYPPGQGRYAYASAGYEMLDKIADTINPEQFKDYLKQNPDVVANFYKRGQADILRAVSNLKPVNMNEFRQAADNLIPRNIAMLRLEGANKYSIISNSDDVFAPASATYLSRDDFERIVSQISDCVKDTMNEVDQNGEKLVVLKDEPAEPNHLATPYSEKVEFANEFDHYRVLKRDGVSVEGVVIPNVIDFDQNKLPLKVFLGKTMGTIQSEIAGVRIDNSSFQLKPHELRTGQTGVFVYMSGKNKALCTVPVTIKLIADEFCPKLKVVDLKGNSFNIRVGEHYEKDAPESIFQDYQRIVKVQDGYVLPRRFFWVPMEGFFEISNNAVDYVAKTAGAKQSATPVTVISTGYDQFAMRGVQKYASAMSWEPTNLAQWQAKFLLASLGAGTQKVASIIKEAKQKGSAVMHDLRFPPLKSEKLASAVPLARAMSKKASEIRSNLIKEASYMENAQTVDALLALNFVTPDNVSKFVGFLPRLKATVSHLCSLILASRLGVQEIPEQAASTAMYRLIDVVNGLEQLRAAQEQGVKP